MKALQGGRIYHKGSFISADIRFDERVESIGGTQDNDEIIDVTGLTLLPGFIDIHIHGINGNDVMDADEDGLINISKDITRFGTTSFLPTTMTMGKNHIINSANNVRSVISKGEYGARPLGIHLEGPFISKEFIGAQNPEAVIEPDISLLDDIADVLRLVTYAPEKDEDNILLDWANRNRVKLSIGHSNATFKKCCEVIDGGVKSVTHLFNAMRPFSHREPGVVGAAFLTDIYSELIADNIHVDPSIYPMLYKVKGMERLILVTDSIRASCLKNGIYDLGGQDVIKTDDSVRLKSNGSLAGSILTQDCALRNIMRQGNIRLEDAVKLLTENPATLLDEDDIGFIDIGYRADFAVLNDDLEVVMTFVQGRRVF